MKIMLDQGAFMPERAHSLDAGLDLRAPYEFRVPGSYNDAAGNVEIGCEVVNTGVHVELPECTVGMVKSKSGLNVKHGLTAEGVVDAGYTGSIVVKLYNHTPHAYTFHRGDKIAQLVILPCLIGFDLEQVDELGDTERGTKGFGSTGR